jgi:hypothetical protein
VTPLFALQVDTRVPAGAPPGEKTQTAAPATKTPGTAEERTETFKPVEGGGQMQSGEALLVEAYAAFWVVLFALIALGWRRQRQLDQRVADLEGAIERARAQAESGSKKAAPRAG